MDVLACVWTAGVEVLEVTIALILDDRVRLNPIIGRLVYLALRRFFSKIETSINCLLQS